MPVALRSHSPVEMQNAAAVAGGDVELALALLGERDQLGQRVDAEIAARRDHHRMIADISDRHEIAQHVDREIRLQLRQRDEIGRKRHVERVAVRRRGRHRLDGDGAGSAGLVEHDHLLAPELRQVVGEHAGADVRA